MYPGAGTVVLMRPAQTFYERINHANGSTFLEISKGNFRRILLVVPVKAVMTAFDRLTRALHERIVSNECESLALAVQRDALLPGLVSGEVGVDNSIPDKIHAQGQAL